MKKLMLLAIAAVLVSGVAFAGDKKNKDKDCSKKEAKGKTCSKKDHKSMDKKPA
ncbi:hypothetical protein [Deminuibacter soli]|uniref:hypothetical protein n=1 Tax=Deminuibacter soli TaxID=2291815 RepID=UPI0013144569|nr:hypothetical protein [Deminuibacter soli]